ncbi:MAG TPA: hypothetical protein DCM01_16000 [Dielma fastidiosa]|nr:hypothetical protein [Dielma fastidiosa]
MLLFGYHVGKSVNYATLDYEIYDMMVMVNIRLYKHGFLLNEPMTDDLYLFLTGIIILRRQWDEKNKQNLYSLH